MLRFDALVARDHDLVLLFGDVFLHAGQVLVPPLVVDARDHVRGEVDDFLEVLRRDVEQVPEARRDTLEVPDVRDGSGKLDVAHPLAANLRARDFDAAPLADDALETDALVLPAVALPVPGRAEDLLAEEPVLLRLQGPVVDRLRLLDLTVGPHADLVRRGKADPELIEVRNVEQLLSLHIHTRRFAAGEVDTQLFCRAEDVLVGVAHLDLLALRRQDVDVQAKRLHLFDQNLERLRYSRLGDVLALDDGLVDLHAAHDIIGLDREQLLQRECRAVGFERPDLHLTEPLAAELRL